MKVALRMLIKENTGANSLDSSLLKIKKKKETKFQRR